MDGGKTWKNVHYTSGPGPLHANHSPIHSYHMREAINTEYNKLPITLTRSNSSKFGGY